MAVNENLATGLSSFERTSSEEIGGKLAEELTG